MMLLRNAVIPSTSSAARVSSPAPAAPRGGEHGWFNFQTSVSLTLFLCQEVDLHRITDPTKDLEAAAEAGDTSVD